MPTNINQQIKVPFRPQIESRDCGLAALSMILAYFGKHVSMPELRRVCSVSREGVRVLNIVQAARYYGLDTKALKRENLKGLHLPAIIFWNFNHFLVVEAVNADSITVQDPAYGRRIIPSELVQRCFSGIVLIFEKAAAFLPSGKAPAIIPVQLFSPVSVFFSAVTCLRIIPEGLCLILLIDTISTGFRPLNWQGLELVATACLLIWLIAYAMLQRKYLGQDLFTHLQSLSPGFFARYYSQELVARLVRTEASYLHPQAIEQFSGIIAAILLLIFLLWLNWFLSLMLLPIAAIIYIQFISSQKERQHHAQYDYWQQRYQAAYANSLKNIALVKRYGREESAISSLDSAIVATFSQNFSQGTVYHAALVFITPALLLILCAFLIDIKIISLTQGLFAFLVAMLSIRYLANALKLPETLHRLRIAFSKLDDVWQQPSAVALPHSSEAAFVNVSFGYAEVASIMDMSFTIPKGQRLGIVGRSGSGKSTIIALLAGHLKPWTGTILTMQPTVLADGSPLLLHGTIRENLRLFDSRISDAEILKILQMLGLENWESYLDDWIDSDSQRFSQSQRQQLDIARALLQHPALLLLDEASSSIDELSEARLLQNLHKSGYTSVIVSHRLSAIRDCDEILVIDKGAIVQRGTHAQLASENGMYSQLLLEGTLL